ncbi:hypothetical protein LTR62_001105 [Meristemomyces frigidus]|uniref:Fe2OG dioxygenase domain-containing protein n=1 Tax=Meristemomyces frigidus TaxID=1508187 RepID=A0AAN7T9B0_9PEZI|nr:hypothetical protein LTR62_001105 [Meristemomyces frigidus]
MAMDDQRIPGPPPSMFYMPNFVSEDEETKLLESIPANKWITLSKRRLQAIPARLTATNTLLATDSSLPPWLEDPIVQRIHATDAFDASPHGRINHCLINEYLAGQGIMPHEDGGAYHPVVATVSLGGSIVLDVTTKEENNTFLASGRQASKWRVLQEPRSLLITCGAAYSDTLHGIAEVTEDVDLGEGTVANWSLLGDQETVIAVGEKNVRTTRISLTFRDVKKVSNLGAKLFGKAKT